MSLQKLLDEIKYLKKFIRLYIDVDKDKGNWAINKLKGIEETVEALSLDLHIKYTKECIILQQIKEELK